MGFGSGTFARAFSANNMGNYSLVSLSIGKKNKETDKYDIDFRDGYVRFVGKAHNQLGKLNLPPREQADEKSKGVSIKLVNCMVENTYMKDGVATFRKNPQYTVFDFEINDESSGGSGYSNRQSQKSTPAAQKAKPAQGGMNEVDDDELPF